MQDTKHQLKLFTKQLWIKHQILNYALVLVNRKNKLQVLHYNPFLKKLNICSKKIFKDSQIFPEYPKNVNGYKLQIILFPVVRKVVIKSDWQFLKLFLKFINGSADIMYLNSSTRQNLYDQAMQMILNDQADILFN